MDAEPTREGKFLSSRILNDGCKCTTWRNANYCFAVTVAIVLLNIILYAVCGSDTGDFSMRYNWGNFSVNNLFQALVNSYTHSNWQHVLLNMLCFLFAGVYLERKKGSLPFLLFMALMSLFTAFAVCTNDISVAWRGFSGVNYGLYGYIGIEYICALTGEHPPSALNGIPMTFCIPRTRERVCCRFGVGNRRAGNRMALPRQKNGRGTIK